MPEKLLLIACHFPPAGGIQVQRALSLAKYLPQNGFEVHVLTTRHPQVPHYDPDLLRQVPSSVRIHRTWSLEPPFHLRKRIWGALGQNRARSDAADSGSEGASVPERLKRQLRAVVTRSLSPDPQRLWYPFALRRASDLIEREKIEIVLVTAPPFSSFLIGNALKRKYPRVRLISEFRDEWLSYFLETFAFRDEAIRRHAAEIERQTIQSSDCVVAVTPTTLRTIRCRYPDQPDNKFHLILNGYDPDVFAGFQHRPHGTDKLVVTYVGTVYKPSSPKSYLDALDSLPEQVRSRFETRFVGRVADEIDQALFQNRRSAVKLVGFVSHRQALRQMEEADYLLLPWADRFNIPGKLYEYLATGKPILGLVPPGGDAHSILDATGVARLVDNQDTAAIDASLQQIGIQHDSSLRRAPKIITDFQRTRLISTYAALIRSTGCQAGSPTTVSGTFAL